MAQADLIGAAGGNAAMMVYNTVSDIFAANEKFRERLLSLLESITEEESAATPDGENWNIRQIVEHLAIVEYGTMRICRKLLAAAVSTGKPGNGRVELGPTFGERSMQIAGIKVEAPERVQPKATQPIAESIAKLKEYRESICNLKPDLENFDLSAHRFPHPFMGDLTAAEWLSVLGGHEARHTKQIERVISALDIKSPGQKEGDPTGETAIGHIS